MKFAVLRGNGLIQNVIFNSDSPTNRDNCFEPYILLRDQFRAAGIQLDTADILQPELPIFEIHQDVQPQGNTPSKYLLMFETEFVALRNADSAALKKYKKIFTWNDKLVDGAHFTKINFPNPIRVHCPDGFAERDRFCCLIAGNWTLDSQDKRILYPERVSSIRWFEANAPRDFDLYGVDWDMPVLHRGIAGRIERKLWRVLGRFVTLKFFPSYRGKVSHKHQVLAHTRFVICYENVRDLSGYITEKIFDCFFSGCVPVYWGASNIEKYIPADCFIDRRRFNDTGAVYAFLKAMTESEFIGYQRRIASFLQSSAALPFDSKFFAATVVRTILHDIDSHTRVAAPGEQRIHSLPALNEKKHSGSWNIGKT